MKQIIYVIIIAFSISLAFSQGKPCCNKKAGKKTVSCKFSHVASDTDKDLPAELTSEESQVSSKKIYKCNTANESQCAKSCTKKTWWKFWAKKSAKNCPCKQADVTKASSTG